MKKSLEEFNAKKKINVFEVQDSDEIKKEKLGRIGYGNSSVDRSLVPMNN